MKDIDIKIKARVENGIVHFELYINGQFYCSGDTMEEVRKDLAEFFDVMTGD